MVGLACAGERALESSALEAGEAQSYSIVTIEGVRDGLTPADRLFFIIGADAFAEICTWYRWQKVVQLVEFIVVTRPGHQYIVPPGARVHSLASVQSAVSSSNIREKLARCEAPGELAPAVFDYIREHRLYGFGSACLPGPA
jgi:nicotinate-nucleotide adenylyltransferase